MSRIVTNDHLGDQCRLKLFLTWQVLFRGLVLT